MTNIFETGLTNVSGFTRGYGSRFVEGLRTCLICRTEDQGECSRAHKRDEWKHHYETMHAAARDRMSVSQIEVFDPELGGCTAKWGFRYLEKRKAQPHASAVLGTELHGYQEKYLLYGETPPQNTKMGSLAVRGHSLMPTPRPFRTNPDELQVESKFRFWRGPVEWVGLLDIYERAKGLINIGDHKTTGNVKYAKTPETLRNNVQANLYAYVSIAETPGYYRAALRWIYYLTKGSERVWPVDISINFGEADEFLKKNVDASAIRAIDLKRQNALKSISAQDLPKNLDVCSAYGGCPYQLVCQRSTLRQMFGASPKETEMTQTSDLIAMLSQQASGAQQPLPVTQQLAQMQQPTPQQIQASQAPTMAPPLPPPPPPVPQMQVPPPPPPPPVPSVPGPPPQTQQSGMYFRGTDGITPLYHCSSCGNQNYASAVVQRGNFCPSCNAPATPPTPDLFASPLNTAPTPPENMAQAPQMQAPPLPPPPVPQMQQPPPPVPQMQAPPPVPQMQQPPPPVPQMQALPPVPQMQALPPVPPVVAEEPKRGPGRPRKNAAETPDRTEGPLEIGTLYIDCEPDEDIPDFGEIVALLNGKIQEATANTERPVEDWRGIDYGKGPAYLIAAISQISPGKKSKIKVRSNDPSWHVLRPHILAVTKHVVRATSG